MEEEKGRLLVVDAGRALVEKGLVARTWGNVSVRLDGENMLITPSGIDYMDLTAKDMVKLNILSGAWQGERKPSGERGVHIAAYSIFQDVNFVIHTHQNLASAFSLAGFESLVSGMSDADKKALGGIALADYGLPGTGKLTEAVKKCLAGGAKTILMAKHGALICAESMEEAMERARKLEALCGAAMTRTGFPKEITIPAEITLPALPEGCALVREPYVLLHSSRGLGIRARLDDMAQMIGRRIPCVDTVEKGIRLLKKKNAVLVKNLGCLVYAENSFDRHALGLLAEKAALCDEHTERMGAKSRVGLVDCMLMHAVYKLKYSKQNQK